MNRAELTRIVDESSRKLLQISIPPVRYWLLYDVMKKEVNDPVLAHTIDECKRYPMRVKLLETIREDGTWPISGQRKRVEDAGPGPPVGWTYTTMLRNLYELGECCTSKDDGRVGLVIDRILGWQTEEGYIPGPLSASIPLPHYNGLALRNITRLGLRDDPRVERLTRWLLKSQRPDGGWVIPYLEDVKYSPRYNHVKTDQFVRMVERGEVGPYDPSEHYEVPSCIWTTLMAVRGLIYDDALARSKAIRRGGEFFLDRFFQKNYHSVFYKSETNWTRLKYPTYLGCGLCALDLLTWIGFGADDPRMEKPIKWLLSTRSNDGFWHKSDRPNAVTDQWITEIAISIVSRYAKTM